jgi:hypothetical protein
MRGALAGATIAAFIPSIAAAQSNDATISQKYKFASAPTFGCIGSPASTFICASAIYVLNAGTSEVYYCLGMMTMLYKGVTEGFYRSEFYADCHLYFAPYKNIGTSDHTYSAAAVVTQRLFGEPPVDTVAV